MQYALRQALFLQEPNGKTWKLFKSPYLIINTGKDFGSFQQFDITIQQLKQQKATWKLLKQKL
jgi:hypothetical protein